MAFSQPLRLIVYKYNIFPVLSFLKGESCADERKKQVFPRGRFLTHPYGTSDFYNIEQKELSCIQAFRNGDLWSDKVDQIRLSLIHHKKLLPNKEIRTIPIS